MRNAPTLAEQIVAIRHLINAAEAAAATPLFRSEELRTIFVDIRAHASIGAALANDECEGFGGAR